MPSTLTTPTPLRSRPQPVYAAADVAKALDLTEGYIRALVSRGVAVPSVPVGSGRRRLFSRADLESLAFQLGRPLRFPDRPDLGPEAA